MNTIILNFIEQLLTDYQNNKCTAKDVSDVLDCFSYQSIQIFQTIMYIGRDFDDALEFQKNNTGLNSYLNCLIWNPNKKIEIGQMTEKQRKIADYFKNGRKILNF